MAAKKGEGGQGNRGELMRLISEAILANVLAFDEAGVLREDMKIIVGVDGGTVMGKGLLFQTPVTHTLSEVEGRLLFETFGALLENYDEGRLGQDRIVALRGANRTTAKIESIRNSLAS